jgi:hypothetical protein
MGPLWKKTPISRTFIYISSGGSQGATPPLPPPSPGIKIRVRPESSKSTLRISVIVSETQVAVTWLWIVFEAESYFLGLVVAVVSGTRYNCYPALRSVVSLIDSYINYARRYKYITYISDILLGSRCGVVVEALRYKPVGCGFDSRWCHWIFSLT